MLKDVFYLLNFGGGIFLVLGIFKRSYIYIIFNDFNLLYYFF